MDAEPCTLFKNIEGPLTAEAVGQALERVSRSLPKAYEPDRAGAWPPGTMPSFSIKSLPGGRYRVEANPAK